MDKSEKARELFLQGLLCSSSVFAAFAPDFGVDEADALKIGSCMGSGLCKSEVCGACLGALMALGLKYGQCDAADKAARQASNRVRDVFLDAFAKENGSFNCRDLLEFDLGDPVQAAEARSRGLFTAVCPKMVASAAKIVDQIMLDNPLNEE